MYFTFCRTCWLALRVLLKISSVPCYLSGKPTGGHFSFQDGRVAATLGGLETLQGFQPILIVLLAPH